MPTYSNINKSKYIDEDRWHRANNNMITTNKQTKKQTTETDYATSKRVYV